MKYELQIAHPNEAVLDQWKHLEDITIQEISESLSSPSFDWYPGLCVRVTKNLRSPFVGIFNERECVNVTSSSEVFEKSFSGEDYDAMRLSYDMNYIKFWRTSGDAVLMMNSIARFMPREYLVRIGLSLLMATSEKIQNAPREEISIIAKWLDGDVTTEETRIIQAELIRSIGDFYQNREYVESSIRLATSQLALATHAKRERGTFTSVMSKTIESLIDTEYQINPVPFDKTSISGQFSGKLRELAPFHNIAEHLVKR